MAVGCINKHTSVPGLLNKTLDGCGVRRNDGQKSRRSNHAAEAIGFPPQQVYKTLVAKGNRTGIVVFCIPVCCELDLKKAAKASGNKDVALIAVKDLLGITGYIRGGCSPVGMKKKYPTYFQEDCKDLQEIAVSAGERGHQMILSPAALVALIGGNYADIVV